jgi:hypothetical protein
MKLMQIKLHDDFREFEISKKSGSSCNSSGFSVTYGADNWRYSMLEKPGNTTLLKIVISTGIFLVAAVLTIQLISQARQNQRLKTDLAEINHIRYGLLNVDEWTDQVTAILSIKILEFKLTPESREKLVHNLETILYTMIDEVEAMVMDRLSGQLSGMQRIAVGMFFNVDQLRDSVPSYANQLLEELNKPDNKAFLQEFLSERLQDFKATTYNLDQMETLDLLLASYGCTDKEECRDILEAAIEVKKGEIGFRVVGILVLVICVFLLNTLTKHRLSGIQSLLLLLSALCLLLGGITTPMIDLEAKINLLLFQLMGEEVKFVDNIIFFQSKSITDVVRILMEEGSLPMIFVGCLVFLFSIIFPSLKLISSLLYAYDVGRLRENKLIRFFVIKSGKWSMADVMVVAIFMAYIGFNGIIGSQLDTLTESAKPVEIFTTNGTRLLGGFYLFLLFCISSLALSEILIRKT